MGDPAATLPSFEELYAQIRALPEHLTGEILEPGVIRTMSRPAKPHRWTAKMLARDVDANDIRTGGTGWWIEVEAEVRLPGGRLCVPDLLGFRVGRVPEVPDENPLTIVPDWCCEILSPSTTRDDIAMKLPLYARSGVPWVWIVDPSARLLEVFETLGGRATLADTATEDDRRVLPPFEREISLASWWMPEER